MWLLVVSYLYGDAHNQEASPFTQDRIRGHWGAAAGGFSRHVAIHGGERCLQ